MVVEELESIAKNSRRYVGSDARRKEDPRLLTGHGYYVGDVTLPRMCHAAFVRSSFPRAAIKSVNLEEAKAAPGVRGVFTGAELSVNCNLPHHWRGSILAIEQASYTGEPLVLVVADTRALAEDAAELVEIDYEPLDSITDLEAAVVGPPIFDGDESNVYEQRELGDPKEMAAFLAQAPHVFSERIQQHRYVHSPMETRGVVAEFHAPTGLLNVWISTQGAHPAALHFAKVLKIDANLVRVICKDVGGAFGQKIQITREETAIVAAARIVGRPVKWIEDRYENLIAGPHARREFSDVDIATDENGIMQAMRVSQYQDCGAYGLVKGFMFERMIPGPYKIGLLESHTCQVHTNTSSRSAYRGPWMGETLVRETMVDIIARKLDIDPLEFRRRNILHREDLPFVSAAGTELDLITCSETMERAVEMLDYEAFRAEQAKAREDGRYIGVGLSVFIEPTAMGARALSDGVNIRIDNFGKALVSTGAGSQGHSIETTLCQVVADELRIHMDDVRVFLGDTDGTPTGATTGGSRNAIAGGNAAMIAATTIRNKILAIAAHVLHAPIEHLDIEDGVVFVVGQRDHNKTYAQIAEIANASENLPAGMEPGLDALGRFTTTVGQTLASETQICTVEVDIATGRVKIDRFIVVGDVGNMINPMVVEGQVSGGVVQGIGGVLYEHFVYSEDGSPMTTTYVDYLIPTSTDVPMIEMDHVQTPALTNPGGFKGTGEGGAIGAPPAIINAIADALSPFGIFITSQPLTPPVIVDLLAAAGVHTA